MLLVNGAPSHTVDALDRGLAYGDGVFRTLCTQDRQPVWWADQYAKLVTDCEALMLTCPEEAMLHAEVCQVAEAGLGIVKILVTRGVGKRGYALPTEVTCTHVVLSAPLPAHALADAPRDIAARWCQLRLSRQPRLARIKHLNRLENVLARAEWNAPDISEGLLCDDGGAVISGVSSNVLWVRDGTLYTPELNECGVEGVARARVLRAAAQWGMPVHIDRFLPDAILAADEVMICNSVIGIRRIAQLGEQVWAPAGWTTKLNTALYEKMD